MARAINTVLNLRDNLSRSLRQASNNTKKFQREIKQASNKVTKFGKSVKNSFKSIMGSTQMLVGSLGLGYVAKECIMLASDLQEVQNVVDVTFGKMSKGINDWSKTALQGYGLSELQAKQFTGTLGALMKSSGVSDDKLVDMSTSLTGLAGDFASFYNLPIEEAFDKIKSAIAGETEPMKALGVNMSVANMEAYALSQGINKKWKAMTQAEQTTLRYNYLMEKTTDAQGDFKRTNKGFANQLRIAKTTLQELGAKIANYVLPTLNDLLIKFTDFLSTLDAEDIINKIKDAFKKFCDVMKEIAPYILAATGAFIGYTVALKAGFMITTLITSFKTFAAALKVASLWQIICSQAQIALNAVMMMNPVILIAMAIAGLIAILVIAYNKSETFRNAVNSLWAKFKEFISGILAQVIPALQQLYVWFMQNIYPTLIKIGQVLYWLWMNVLAPIALFLINVFGAAFTFVFNLISGVVQTAIVFIGESLSGVMTFLSGIIDFITGVFTGNWELAWQGIVGIFTGIWDTVKSVFKGVINFIIDGVNAAIKGVNALLSFEIPDWVPLIGGKGLSVNIPMIPKFATGTGYFSGGKAEVGEHGGEILDLPNGTRVIPHMKSKNIADKQSGQGMNVNINIQGNVIGTNAFMEQTGAYVADKIKLALLN